MVRCVAIIALAITVAPAPLKAGDDAIRRVISGIIEADNRGDLGTVLSLYSEDARGLGRGPRDHLRIGDREIERRGTPDRGQVPDGPRGE